MNSGAGSDGAWNAADGLTAALLYDRGYFVCTDGPVAQRPYALLVEALARTGRVGIAKFVVRTREHLAVLRPRRGVLVVHALRWPRSCVSPLTWLRAPRCPSGSWSSLRCGRAAGRGGHHGTA
ncbi:Ku protein [Streptomyces sp. NBC_00322]|uniref:Ku protein n=1 Tax=Streptomyces sp. NBC_00322 TaxID=2975712 RepID=UPI003FA74A05